MVSGGHDRPRDTAQPPSRALVRARQGPFLAAALLCERVIEEKDGSLTAVRLIDQLTIEPGSPEPNVVTLVVPLRLSLLVSIREGEIDHPYEISITVRDPSGTERKLKPAGQMLVAGPVAGGNFIAHLMFSPQLDGMYFFEIELDGEFLSRIPVNVVRQAAPSGAS